MEMCKKCGQEIRGDVCEFCYVDSGPIDWKTEPYVKYIIPNYDERTIFLVSIVSIMIFFTNEKAIEFVVESINENFWFIGHLIAALLAVYFSIFHAFSKNKKSDFEKRSMLHFVVLMNSFTGIVAGSYIINNLQGFWAVFPAINIINGVMLLLMLKFKVINESNISDENASLSEIVVSGTIAVIVFMVSFYQLNHPWFITFSICLAYATNFNGPVVYGLEKLVKTKKDNKIKLKRRSTLNR